MQTNSLKKTDSAHRIATATTQLLPRSQVDIGCLTDMNMTSTTKLSKSTKRLACSRSTTSRTWFNINYTMESASWRSIISTTSTMWRMQFLRRSLMISRKSRSLGTISSILTPKRSQRFLSKGIYSWRNCSVSARQREFNSWIQHWITKRKSVIYLISISLTALEFTQASSSTIQMFIRSRVSSLYSSTQMALTTILVHLDRMEQELQCTHIRQGQLVASLMKEMSGIKSRLHRFARKSLRMHRISSRIKCQRRDCEEKKIRGWDMKGGISNEIIPCVVMCNFLYGTSLVRLG